jgi:hypothetical protein
VTNRRWMEGFDDRGPGPLESSAVAELETLGFTPLTPPGALRTAAQRALHLAETYDRCQNSATLPGLDRQFAVAMDDARRASEGDSAGLRDEPTEVADFERERRQRRPPPPPPPAVQR